MKAVLDTNVLISGMINTHHAPGRIIDMVRSGRLLLVVDDRILAEYRSVLLRERMRQWLSIEDAKDIISFLTADTERIVANTGTINLTDAGDAPFIEIAITAKVPLITGNLKHFSPSLCRSHPVISPSEFLRKNEA